MVYVKFNICPLLRHIHTDIRNTRVHTRKFSISHGVSECCQNIVKKERYAYWQHLPQSRGPDKAAFTALRCTVSRCTWGRQLAHPIGWPADGGCSQEGKKLREIFRPEETTPTTQEPRPAQRWLCLYLAVLPLPCFIPRRVTRRKGAFILAPTAPRFFLSPLMPRGPAQGRNKEGIQDRGWSPLQRKTLHILSQPTHTSGSTLPPAPAHSTANGSFPTIHTALAILPPSGNPLQWLKEEGFPWPLPF